MGSFRGGLGGSQSGWSRCRKEGTPQGGQLGLAPIPPSSTQGLPWAPGTDAGTIMELIL